MNIKLNDKNIYVDYIKRILEDNKLYTMTSDLYDQDTHKALVEYINKLKNGKNINLFDLINLADNTYLKKQDIIEVIDGEGKLQYNVVNIKEEDKLFKIYKIPVTWDMEDNVSRAKYTIKVNSLKQPVIVAGAGYKNNKLMSNTLYNPATYYDMGVENKQELKQVGENSYEFYDKNKIIIEFEIIGQRDLVENFYLLVKVPKDTKEIIITKGDIEIKTASFKSETNEPILLLSKLIEYLSGMIIYEDSPIEEILYFQEILNSNLFGIRYGMQLINYTSGVYDESMKEFIKNFQKEFVYGNYREGYIDKETEREIRSIK